MAVKALITDETGKAIKDALASIQQAIQQQGQGGQGGGVSISFETDPETLTTLSQSVVYFLVPGTWTAFSPAVTVPAGKFGIAKYGTAWAVTVLGGGELASAIAAMTAADELTGDEALPMGSGESVTVQQLAEFAEGVVGGNAAHASGESADQARLASVGRVAEMIVEDSVINREPVTKSSQTIIENFVIGGGEDVGGIETLSDTTIVYQSKLSTYSGANVYYFSVNKGERFNILINSVGSPSGAKGFRVALKEGASAPSLNDTVTSLQVSYVENSGGEVHPTEIQFIAQSDGYLCFNGTDGVIVSIDKYDYKKPEASSYIEENIVAITDKANVAYGTLYRATAKRYKLERGAKYMVVAGPGYGSDHTIEISFYDGNMGLVPDTTVTYTDLTSNRKIIEADDFLALIPNDAVYCEIKAQLEISAALTRRGTCALLREVDGIFAPQNNYIYGISKIKNNTSYVWSAWGFKLPNNYSNTGNATQIVTYIHGSSGFVTSYMMGYNNPIVHDKLLDNGFAVLDINGCGVYFSNDVDTSKCAGNPVAVETLAEAYNAIRKTFNVKDGMVISGVSMGGCLMETFTMRHPELVKFIAFLAPMILSGYQLGIAIDNTGYADKAWDAVDDYAKFQQNCVGYVSMSNPMMLEDGTAETITAGNFTNGVGFKTTDGQVVAENGSNVVLDSFNEGTYKVKSKFAKSGKIWLGTNDVNIDIASVLRFVSAARLNGCNFDLRICPGLDHSLATNNNYVLDELIGYINSKL